ncbi:MAG TPA: NAD(P)/FAD-dependent oxidoreductase [Vicinamibacterales bacterium]|jgi:phytoene dehydrogenase-like protein|nr:NAD(P)/FAD-dependent oxidoreductase [Vicinamibacterales bacterium]
MASRSPHDAIVIGGGHNGLVAAAYLARAGRRALVLERRDVVGGCAVTEERWPGFHVSTAAYVCSLFRPGIVRDLDLRRHGFELLARSPSSFTPLPDGRYLLMGPDRAMTRREVSKFSAADATALDGYESLLESIASIVEPMLDETPPNPWARSPRQLFRLLRRALAFRALGGRGAAAALQILAGPANALLDRWFESEPLKATLATDAIIGAFATPSMPGTGYVLLHHVMGQADGVRGVWGYVRGGMGALSSAIAAAAREHGAEIRTGVGVCRIIVHAGRAVGVADAAGNEYRARAVLSNLDAHSTFLQLLDRSVLPSGFVDAVRAIDYSSGSCKINFALSEAPRFRCLGGDCPGPPHRGTIHLCPSRDDIERAFDCAKYGYISETPIIEATLPTAVDASLAPPGRHVMSMFTQYFPYRLAPDAGTLDANKRRYAERCIDVMTEYAPNFRTSVIDYEVLSPRDLEATFGLTGGNIMQGAMSLTNLWFMRPVAGYADYRTPIRGLYLCGAAAHPGGGVIGACGRNAAREVLADL